MDPVNIPKVPNGDFDIVLEETEDLGRERSDGIPNRELAASAGTGLREFNARTQTVQWGTYNGKDAVLLVFGLSFIYQDGSHRRMTQARIRIGFEEVTDPGQPGPDLRNAPIVRSIRPGKWELYAYEEKKAPIMLKADPEIACEAVSMRLGSIETQISRKPRKYSVTMQANGSKSPGQTFHIDEASWLVSSTGAKDVGIVRDFKIALVVEAPRNPPSMFCAYMDIEASMGTGITARFTRKLRTETVHAVLLDRTTSKPPEQPQTYGTADQDFADASFPWHELGLLPTEAKNVDSLTL